MKTLQLPQFCSLRAAMPAVLATLLTLFAAPSAQAAALNWDANTGSAGAQDGSGTWTTGAGGWWTGAANVNWAANDTATFGAGADGAYTITVGGAISAGTGTSLSFTNSGYLLRATSAQMITCTGNLSISSGKTATISTNVTITRATSQTVLGGGTLNITNSGARLQTTGSALFNVSGASTRIVVGTGGTFSSQNSMLIGSSTDAGVALEVMGGDVSVSSTANANLIMAQGASGSASITLTSGTISNSLVGGSLRFGVASANTSSSTFNLNGGTLTVPRIFEGNAGHSSTFNFNGGTLRVLTGSSSLATFMTGLDTNNVRNGGAIIDANGQSVTIGQALQHSAIGGDNATDGGLTKIGAGTLTLTSGGNYTGPTTISIGTLALSGSAALTASTNISIASGATLDVSAQATPTLAANQHLLGTGSVNGSLTTVATTKIFPATDGTAGTLTFSNSLTLDAATQVQLDLSSTYNGSNDKIVLNGNSAVLTANGAQITIKSAGTLDTSVNDYLLIDLTGAGASISGSFNATPAWAGTTPGDAANYSIVTSGTQVKLHYAGTTSPAGIGSAVPATLTRSQTTLLTVTVTPGTSPASTGIAVTADLSSIDGSATQIFYDDGSNGDVTASDSVFSYSYTIPTTTSLGAKSLSAGITDAQSRSATANIALTVVGANVTWAASPAGVNWGTGAHWAGGVSPGTGDLVFFGTSTELSPNLETGYSVGGVTFNSGAGSYTIGGSTLTLTGGVTNNSTSAQTLNVPVALGTSQTINAASGDVALGGVVSGSGKSLTKVGAGTLTLSANNSYDGGTLISGGIVQVGAGGTTGNLGTGAVTNNGTTLTFNRSDATLNVASVISGTGAVQKNGSGTVTLSGANTYSGATTIANGALQLDAGNNRLPTTATVTLGDGASGSGKLILGGSTAISQTLAAVVTSGSGTANAVVGGHGTASTLTLNVGTHTTLGPTLGGGGANENNLALTKATISTVLIITNANTYDGVTTVSAGAIVVSNNAALGSTVGATTVAVSGTIALSGGVNVAENFSIAGPGSGAIGGSEVSVLQRGAIQSSRGSNVVSGNITITAASTRIGCQDGAHLTLTGTITTNGLVSGLIFRNGNFSTSTTTISGTGNDWGDTEIYTGVTRLGVNDGLPINGRLTIGLGALTTNSTFDMNGYSQTLLNLSSAGPNPGIMNSGATQSVLTINNTETNRIYGGFINGSIALVKDGPFPQTLSGTNLYTGDTTINGGTLSLSGGGSIANSSNLTVAAAATLDVSAVSGVFTLAAHQTLRGNGTVLSNLVVNGTVAPGTSIGTLTNSGATASSLAGTLVAELDRNGGSPLADKFVMAAGTLTLGGTLTVTNIGATLVNGDTFDLLDGTLSGSFGTLNLPHGAGHWLASDLNVGGTITFTNASPVAGNFNLGVAVGGATEVQAVGKHTSDADGDALTITVLSSPANGTASIVGGTNILYTSTNSAASDSFTYMVSDGFTTATATVTVMTYPAEGFNRLSPASVIAPGTVAFTYLGIPGEDYALEHATNLVPPISWSAVITNTAAGNGFLYFTNTSTEPQNYFRTRHVP